MSKINHTPGPWSYNELSANRILGPDNQVIAASYGGTVGDQEQTNNTRLIASAPILYEFLSQKVSEGDQSAREILKIIEGTA